MKRRRSVKKCIAASKKAWRTKHRMKQATEKDHVSHDAKSRETFGTFVETLLKEGKQP